MANDLTIKDGAGATKKVRTTDVGADVHVPHKILTDSTGNPIASGNPLPTSPNVSRNAGATDANTQRVALASDSPGVSSLAAIDTAVGAQNAAAAAADGTGNYGVLSALKRGLLNWATLLARIPALVGGRVPVDGSGVVQPAGGITRRVEAQFTRPGNTTAYASGQLVANSTTAGSVTPMTFAVARVANGSGAIVRARIRKSGTTTANASFRLHLYRATPTPANGDGGVWLTNGAMIYIGALDVTCDRAFNDGAAGNGIPLVGAAINFDLSGTGSQNILGLLEARGAYAPANAETFTVDLEVYQD